MDPSGKALVTVVGLHDHEITDADLDLIQDLQDQKRASLLEHTTSGSITYQSFQFNPFSPNTFFVPSFDVLFNGEVLHIAGQQSADLNLNRVVLPPPVFWAPGTPPDAWDQVPDARIYVVYLELWYQYLDNGVAGTGYFKDPQTQARFFFPYGGILPDPSNAEVAPDDTIDPFQGLETTQRAQIQWCLRVSRVPLTYDFKTNPFGLNYDTVAGGNQVQAQAGQPNPIPGSAYQFVNMGPISGDTGVWRAGTNDPNTSSLASMDGNSYAMPIAVVFQRNTGNYSIADNVFGCADPNHQGSGVLSSRISGRFDSKLADQIFPGDTVDTRSTVNLTAWDFDKLLREGWADLVMGKTRLGISRGESPGNKSEALGSTLAYRVAMSPTPVANCDTIGQFSNLLIGGAEVPFGFANGFGADARNFLTSVMVTTNQKSVGILGGPWVLNDAVTISLPTAAGAAFNSVTVTALVSNNQTGTKSPAALLQGQVQIDVGQTTATITFTNDLSNTAFDPGTNPLIVVIGVTFAAGSGVDLRRIPLQMNGGLLTDTVSGKTLPVYGVSEYTVQQSQLALEAANVWSINPEFSDVVFGTKIWLAIPGTDPRLTQTVVGGSPVTVLTLDRLDLNGDVNGLYVTRAWDFTTGNFYSISQRIMSGGTSVTYIQGSIDPASTLMVSVLAQDTAQASYVAPVKAISTIEETVLLGNYTANASFPMDPRVSVVSIGYDSVAKVSTVVMAANGATIEGISGDDVAKFIWIADNIGNLNATSLTSANVANGVAVFVVSGVDLTTASFFVVGAINPGFSKTSTLIISSEYVPYQGEGVLNRDYEFVHAEDNALVTTNGTGSAPIAGQNDIFPYNRELPIITSMPAQLGWNDATALNEPIASFFDSNFVAMRLNNVEHTFLIPLHTLDYVPPMNRDIRKTIRFTTTGGRGFAKATPHFGFGIAGLTARTVLGQNLQATIAPIQLFVNNASGDDTNTGLDTLHAKRSISSALAQLPPVLRHPCVIILMDTGIDYRITDISAQGNLDVIALGDGDLRSAKAYALGNLSRVIQDAGRLVISRQTGATNTITISAAGFPGFGDGPTHAFYLDTTRVILNGIRFTGFTNPAMVAYNADIDMVDCVWDSNVQAGAYTGCDVVVLDRGKTTVPDGGVGHVCVQSNLTSSDHALEVAAGAANPGAFYVGTRNSTLNLSNHGTGTIDETNIVAATVIADAELNSSIAVTGDFQSAGMAVLKANSTLSRTVTIDPFEGGVSADSSSSVVTNLG